MGGGFFFFFVTKQKFLAPPPWGGKKKKNATKKSQFITFFVFRKEGFFRFLGWGIGGARRFFFPNPPPTLGYLFQKGGGKIGGENRQKF